MVTNPTAFVLPTFTNITTVISQIEANNISDFIKKCQSYGYQIGLSLKPETDIESVLPYIEQINLVQLMTVSPGGQGRPFVEKVLPKIKELKQRAPNIEIQVDGAMDRQHINYIEREININHYVVGSDIFKNENPIEEEEMLQSLID